MKMGVPRFVPVWGVATGQPREHEREERPGRGSLRVPGYSTEGPRKMGLEEKVWEALR